MIRKTKAVVLMLLLIPATLSLAQDLQSRADAAYGSGQFETAARLYKQAAECDRFNATLLYNGACSASLAGWTDDAFELLGQAMNVGFSNADLLRSDSDLQSLHDDPRWAAVVGRATSAASRNETFWKSDALVGEYNERLPEDLRVAGLSRIWSEVKYNFANFDLVPDVDIDASYLEFLPRVRSAVKTSDYYLILMEFMALLRDGHTNVYPPAAAVDQIFARPAMDTRLIEGSVLVIRVDDPSLREAGITTGMEVVSLDSVAAIEYGDAKIRQWQAASTRHDSDVRTFEHNFLTGAAGSVVTLELEDTEGERSTHQVKRLSRKERADFRSPRPPFAMRELPGNVLHIELNSFNEPTAFEEFLARFDEISKFDALILDVRNNGGGNSTWGWNILSMLTDEPFATSIWETRLYRPVYRAWGQGEAVYGSSSGSRNAHGTNQYGGPVVVLTSPRTYSAAEDFTVVFDVMDRGKIVGQPTGGSTGQPLIIRLPGGGSARICSKRDRYPDGTEFVGVGIQPDVEVAPTIADTRAGRDRVLEKALEVLGK
jgi:C-terminal processing protease CtpA/Prc